MIMGGGRPILEVVFCGGFLGFFWVFFVVVFFWVFFVGPSDFVLYYDHLTLTTPEVRWVALFIFCYAIIVRRYFFLYFALEYGGGIFSI